MDSPDRSVLRFETTAKASADAHALANPSLTRFDLVLDIGALLVALFLVATGYVPLGVAVGVVAGLSLFGRRFHPLQRALIARRYRSLLGQTTEVTIEDDGLRSTNPLGTSFIPWTSMTAVRSNSETVAFFRDRVLVGYIPASAFDSPAAQARLVDLVVGRISSRP